MGRRGVVVRGAQLTSGECEAAGCALIKALQHTAVQNIVLRDLKPANVLFSGDAEGSRHLAVDDFRPACSITERTRTLT